MAYHLRTVASVTAVIAALRWLGVMTHADRAVARSVALLKAISARLPRLPLVLMWAAALVPMCWMSVLVLRYAVDMPMLDDWEMAKLIVKQRLGQLHFADIFEQQQEARTVLPKLVFLASTMGGTWDVRSAVVLTLVCTWLTTAGIFVLLRRTGLRTPLLAICFWVAVLCIFSPAQYEVWIFASGFPSFLPAAFMVCAFVVLTGHAPLRMKFLVSALFSAASSLTLPHGLLAWGLTFPMCVFARPPQRWARWLGAWFALCVVCAAIYFWGYQKPAYLPEFAPKIGLTDYLRFGAIFSGGLFAFASTAKPAVTATCAGILLLASLVAVMIYVARDLDDEALRARTMPWLALAFYSVGSATLATLGRVGYGAEYALASRYVPFSLYLVVGVFVLVAIVAQQRAAFRHRLGFAVAIAICLLFFIPYKRAAANTRYFLRHDSAEDRLGRTAVMFSRVLDTHDVIQRVVYPPEPAVAIRLAAQLDDAHVFRHPLVRSAILTTLPPHALADGKRAAGALEKSEVVGDKVHVAGWAVLNEKRRQPDGVLLAYETPDRQWIAVAVADSVAERPDIVKRFRDVEFSWAGWNATLPAGAVPAGARISAWAFDADETQLYKLEGETTAGESR